MNCPGCPTCEAPLRHLLEERSMGTKASPGRHDCHAKAEPDEPLFTLLARDPLAPVLVELWAGLRQLSEGPTDKVREAFSCAGEMRRWRPSAEREERGHREWLVRQLMDDGFREWLLGRVQVLVEEREPAPRERLPFARLEDQEPV